VDDLTNTAFLRRPDLHVETDGEFAGWRTWSRDRFESNNGPFWHKMDDDGRVRCAFRVEQKHLNGQRNVHGGAFMTFADYCLFAFASPVLQGPGVTVSFACEFLDAAHEGDLIEGTGEITRAGGSLFARHVELRRAAAVCVFRDDQAGEDAAAGSLNGAAERLRSNTCGPEGLLLRTFFALATIARKL
jgi:acyl-coenzyme A thioesterase PaaI-like protein